jgi:hypothetical protein
LRLRLTDEPERSRWPKANERSGKEQTDSAKNSLEKAAQSPLVEKQRDRDAGSDDRRPDSDVQDPRWSNPGARAGQQLQITPAHAAQGEGEKQERQAKGPAFEAADDSGELAGQEVDRDAEGSAAEGQPVRNAPTVEIEGGGGHQDD